MIVELLFKLFIKLFDFVISLIPSFNFDIDFGILDFLKVPFEFLDVFVSVSLITSIFTIILIRDNFVFLKNIFMSIVNKIPFL